MTTKTAWAHLPNARHIDAVLASMQARPEEWALARKAAWAAIPDKARIAAWRTARSTAQAAALDVAWGSALALAAWDSSAELLDLPPDVLRTMIDLAPEPVCHQAVLLLPYAIVREGE